MRNGTGAPAPRRRVRWGALAGAVVFVYVVVYAIAIAAAGLSPRLHNRIYEASGNAVARLVLSCVLFAALFHAGDGLRMTLCAMVPSLERRERGLKSMVQFVTFAAGIPAAVAVCWPSLSELFK